MIYSLFYINILIKNLYNNRMNILTINLNDYLDLNIFKYIYIRSVSLLDFNFYLDS
jgi:hypothetical protein